MRPAGSLCTVPEAMRCQFASCEHVMVISTKPRVFICKTDLSALYWTQLLQLALLGRPVASLPIHSEFVAENILLRALYSNHHTRFILFSIAAGLTLSCQFASCEKVMASSTRTRALIRKGIILSILDTVVATWRLRQTCSFVANPERGSGRENSHACSVW